MAIRCFLLDTVQPNESTNNLIKGINHRAPNIGLPLRSSRVTINKSTSASAPEVHAHGGPKSSRRPPRHVQRA
eukprot:6863092-Lingulodinium_polyedra.AAC.1